MYPEHVRRFRIPGPLRGLILAHALDHELEEYGYDKEQSPGFDVQHSEGIEGHHSHEPQSEKHSLPHGGMDSVYVDFPPIIELFEEVYDEREKRASREKTGDPHDGEPHIYIILQIHIEKEEQCGSDAGEEDDEYREQVDVFFHRQ